MSLTRKFEKLLNGKSKIVGDFEDGIDKGMKTGYYNGNSSVDRKVVRKIESIVIQRATEDANEFLRLYINREASESDIPILVRHRKETLWDTEDYKFIHSMCQKRNYQKVQFQKKEIIKTLKGSSEEFKRGFRSTYELYWFVGAISNLDIIMEEALIDKTGLYDIAFYDILSRNHITPKIHSGK